MCTGTPVHHEHTVGERVAGPGWWLCRVCRVSGTPVHSEHTVGERVFPGQGGGGGEYVRVPRYTMCRQPGNEWPGQGRVGGECVRINQYTVPRLPERECQALNNSEQTLRKRVPGEHTVRERVPGPIVSMLVELS